MKASKIDGCGPENYGGQVKKKNSTRKYMLAVVGLAVVAAGIYIVATSGGNKEVTGKNTVSPGTTAAPTSEQPATSTTAKEEPSVVSGDAKAPALTPKRELGFITKVYEEAGARFLRIDYVQLLGGREAAKALIEDGGCTGTVEECIPPNDYYLRNQNPKIRTFEISRAAGINAETPGADGPDGRIGTKPISYETFKSYFDGTETNESSAPYWISLENDLVTEITLMYIP